MIRRIVESLWRRPPAPSPEPDPMAPALRRRLDAAMQDAAPAIALSYAPGRVVAEEPVSSLGGRPSLPPGTPWPTDGAGNPMVFLAQLNYADLPPLDGHPSSGLLSFFVSDDAACGNGVPARDQAGFATLFTPDPAQAVRHAPPPLRRDGFTPFGGALAAQGAPLTGRAGACPVLPLDWRARPRRPDETTGDRADFSDALTGAKPGALYCGGNPDFTQRDFRSAGRSAGNDAALDTVLLQIGYVGDVSPGWYVSWGDAGEACFLIAHEDLIARRFDRAVYHWDCY